MVNKDEKSSIFELEEAYNQYRHKYLSRYYTNFKDAREAILDLIKDIDYVPEDLLKLYSTTCLIKYDLASDSEVINNIHKTFRNVLLEKFNNHDQDTNDES
jgi:hypothetical protein